MGGACSSACCSTVNNELDDSNVIQDKQKPFSQANLLELNVNDEQQLKRLEAMIKAGKSGFEDLAGVICSSSEVSLRLLRIKEKSKEQYECKPAR